MQYQITHSLQYSYDQAVLLLPHNICLQPRTDSFQTLINYQLELDPAPLGQMVYLDAIGNLVTRCWWMPQEVQSLSVVARSLVRTTCANPFNYLLEPWAIALPIDYPRSQFELLLPYLKESGDFLNSAAIHDWAKNLAYESDFNIVQFLGTLNQLIYQEMTYQSREVGEPWPPSVTWQQKQGSCRDFVLLFMAACYGVGLASRFVSGYEKGAPEHEQTLHAWVEVYLPGAGWRGYDPTLGLVVCDRHVVLAAHRFPKMITPINGGHRGQSHSTLDSHVNIEVVETP